MSSQDLEPSEEAVAAWFRYHARRNETLAGEPSRLAHPMYSLACTLWTSKMTDTVAMQWEALQRRLDEYDERDPCPLSAYWRR